MKISTTETLKEQSVSKLYNLTFELTNQCVQCGYCLPVCPTYEAMGKETQSPRGRINLIKQASLGKIDIIDHLAEPIDLCLVCRACEIACPVRVPYGEILDDARKIIIEEQGKREKIIIDFSAKNFFLQNIFPYPKVMRGLGNLTWLYQKSGAYKVIRKTKVLDKISKPIAEIEKSLPLLESPSKRFKSGVYQPKGVKKGKVAFFTGCVTDATMYRTNRLSVELLNLIGLEVIIHEKQNCCGALHFHQGLHEKAKILAKENIIAFEKSGADYLVNNAGGCGAMLSEYDKLLKDEMEWHVRAKTFVNKSKDISKILIDFGPLPYKKEWKGIITYQDSCHLKNVQGVHKEPRFLLKSIPGVTYIEMENNKCCGSGGIYNIIHFEESMKILDLKMKSVKATKATTIVTANPGCMLQINLGINRHDLTNKIEAIHLVDILAEVCELE